MRTLIIGAGLLVAVALLVASGCSTTGRVQTTPSAGVDRIPATVAIHPLLSGSESEGPYSAIRPMTQGSRKEIYLSPPSESELVVTPSSQMLTGEMSMQMTRLGFDLREMPVEVRDSYGSDGGKAFVISLALLDELRDEYGLEAVIVGNAFFAKDTRQRPSEMRVVAAYLKVIDTKTLEVLCQVTMSYDSYGRELNDVAQTLAYQLADMAGLNTE